MTVNSIETWNLDPSHSEVGMTVRHAGISKVRAKFTEFNATVHKNETEYSVEAVIQANSFDSGNSDRDGHVKSADFLDVENFPTLEFRSTSIRPEGDGTYVLSGELTLRGVTKPVSFEAEITGEAVDPFGNLRTGLEAKTTISRKEFGLTWNAVLEAGGVLVSDKVIIELDLSFIKEVDNSDEAN